MLLHLFLVLIITIHLNLKPMYVRYFMAAEIMTALANVLLAEKLDAVKYVATMSQDNAKS